MEIVDPGCLTGPGAEDAIRLGTQGKHLDTEFLAEHPVFDRYLSVCVPERRCVLRVVRMRWIPPPVCRVDACGDWTQIVHYRSSQKGTVVSVLRSMTSWTVQGRGDFKVRRLKRQR